MIDVKEQLEKKLGEKVIFVTSYEPGRLHFLAVTKEGTTHTESLSTKVLTGLEYGAHPLEDIVLQLYKSILELRAYEKAKLDKRNAERTIQKYERSQSCELNVATKPY